MAQIEFITLLLISVSTSMVIVFTMLSTNRRWASLMAEMDRQFERMNRHFERFDHRSTISKAV